MKKLQIGILLFTTLLISSCENNSQKDQITGEWTLSSFSNDTKIVELTDCDKKTTWNFTTESAEALGDGTKVQKLNSVAPENCKFYGFDAKWTVKDGQLFLSTSRIGGIGGNSFAGLMEIKELTNNKMVLKMMKKELTLKK